MGLYIINKNYLQIPKTCSQCKFREAIDCDGWKHVRSVYLDRHRDCPLLKMPEESLKLLALMLDDVSELENGDLRYEQ